MDRFLDDLEARYGGIDAVLLWATYPNMGVDERSQFDLLDDLPGGLAALKAAADRFHARGVRVGLPYNPWDTGTARRAQDDPTVLASIAAAVGADFANGDTMGSMPAPFFADAAAAGAPLALQPEGGGSLETLAWSKWGWGYWGGAPIPSVDALKWVEHRHATQICNRWGTMHTPAPSHTLDLQHALFNGDGFVAWESIWGTWNGLSLRDAEATRRVGALLRFLAPFFSAGPEAGSATWTPHALVTPEAYAGGIFASQWALPAGGGGASLPFKGDATAWTVVGYGGAPWRGATLPVPCDTPLSFFDLYAGAAVRVINATSGGGCALPLAVEAGGFGAALALGAADGAPPPARLLDFLAAMAQMTARPLASFDTAPTLLQQEMTLVAPAPLPAAPPGAVLVPGAAGFPFSVAGTEIEGRTVPGNDVQFPWEALAGTSHAPHRVDVPNLFVDATPVTNAQFGAFLARSGYAPSDAHNFLRDWNGSAPVPPVGWGAKPVTWVDLLDARAFCAEAGKRLPHDWEWQYIAQNGTPWALYPWGAKHDPARVPPQAHGAARPPPPDVGSFPGGDTPLGVKDMMGLVWQWTDEFTDAHTRAALVRGGSYYAAAGSSWYFPNDLGDPSDRGVNLLTHNKLLLMGPAYDRHGAVGFRCVADAPGAPPPPPPAPPAGCADGTCDAFCENARVQGCEAALPTNVSMRAPATGAPCGGSSAPCAAPADACAAGWRLCLSDFSVAALSADGFRAAMPEAACAAGSGGRFIAAMSHADCKDCGAAPSNVDKGCAPSGCGSEAICCGAGCVRAACASGLYPNATTIYDNQAHGCGNVAPAVAAGVLCCKVD